ncbi:hypothetical protein F2Q69_00047898 [Brassica cretica]|uniref:Uncharacterized protein n=1 Tax=Brassica cretica TaxID=69181 RepID=A0A8S9PYQ3_BRACR|nr:hypothetical protein F2Q69_00047898 [Brassica cretica]
MNADLPHLGAGYPVLRSKICQGGGYDAVIRTATEPENRPNQFYTRLNWKLTSSISFKPGIGDEEIISTSQKVFQKSLAAPEPRRSGGSLKKSLNQTRAIYGKIEKSFGLISSKPINSYQKTTRLN